MPSPRPGSVTAAAVLSIIYGSLFTLCGLCGMVSLVAQEAMGKNLFGGDDPVREKLQKEVEAALRNDVPGYQAVDVGGKILGLGGAVALLCAGIGLLSMRSWARKLALIVCLIAIAATILQAVYQAVLVIPAMNKVLQEVLPPFLARQQDLAPQAAEVLRLMPTVMTLFAVGMAILYFVLVVYLFIIFMLLNRQHVRAAFAAAAAGTDARPPDQDVPPGAYEDDPGWGQDPKDDWRYRS
jgi:hypothetical protein